MPQLRSGCVGFGALQDLTNFITSVHSHLEKANLFQRGAFGNSRRYHSQVSSAQQNMIFFSFFFFLSKCQYLFPSLPLLPSFPELESCVPGPYVLPRGRGGSGTCPLMPPQAHVEQEHVVGVPAPGSALAQGGPGASADLRVQQMALYYPHPSCLCYQHIVIAFINQA